MSYLDRLKDKIRENHSPGELTKLTEPGFVGFVSDPDRRICEKLPADLQEEWERGIASLEPDKPLGCYDADRWRRIVRDCDNLIADFGKSAAALGWSTIDLFGFPADALNLGGLVWRLDGGRLIAMDENCATYRWPYSDRTSRFARGYLEQMAARFVPVWELGE